MEEMKKIIALLLTFMMLFGLATTAFATEVSINKSDDDLVKDNTFVAYQIFKGEWDDVKQNLSDIIWGGDIDGATFLTVLKGDTTIGGAFTDANSAADVAEAMNNWSNNSPNAEKFAELAYNHVKGKTGKALSEESVTLHEGYYLIVDTTTVADQDKVANKALLQVVGDSITIAPKTAKTTGYS